MSKPPPSQVLDPGNFPAPKTRAVRAATRRAEITVSRFKREESCRPQAFSMADRDGYLLIYQLRDHPAHEFWSDGRFRPTLSSPEGHIHIIDLAGEPVALIASEVDSLHIHIPDLALRDLAEDMAAAPVEHLRTPLDWQTVDPVLTAARPLLLAALDTSTPTTGLFFDHVGIALAGHIAHTYGGMRPHIFRTGELAPWQLSRAKELLADNLRKTLSLPEVAAQVGLSVAHFSRAFKISTGQAPHAWLQERRLDRARSLLARDVSLAEIAMACGYADQSHFSRLFKRATGIGPGAYRRLGIPA